MLNTNRDKMVLKSRTGIQDKNITDLTPITNIFHPSGHINV